MFFLYLPFLNYYLNKKFTFRIKHKTKLANLMSFIKYSLVCLFSLVIGLNILLFLVEFIHITPYISNIFNIFVTAIINYTGSKYIVFIGEKKK